MSWDVGLLQRRGEAPDERASRPKGYSVSLHKADLKRAQDLMSRYGIRHRKGSGKGMSELFVRLLGLAEGFEMTTPADSNQALDDLRQGLAKLAEEVRRAFTIGSNVNECSADTHTCRDPKESEDDLDALSRPKKDASEIHNHNGTMAGCVDSQHDELGDDKVRGRRGEG